MTKFPYPIIDAHHHLWDLEAVHYPWLATKGITRFFGDPAPIQKNYLPADFRRDIADLPVEGSVHIQVGADEQQHLLESQTAQKFADSSGLVNGIVAFCPLENPDRTEMLDKLTELPNFRGVRQIIGRSPDEDRQTGTGSLLNNLMWVDGLRELEARGLSFDLQLIPDQMQLAAEVLSQFPDLKIAVCHCGSPWYRDDEGWALWKDGLQCLADNKNAYCKISGLSMFEHAWTIDSLRPIITKTLEAFGLDRCMFGSNFPVDKLHTDYQRLWYAYLEIAHDFSPAPDDRQIRALFKENCASFYQLSV